MKEPKRYIADAKELLRKSPIEGKLYADTKYVKSACGVAYLGVLEAINEQLQTKYGISRKDLPKKVEEYRKALQKHVSVHNGKLLKEFDALYDELHIAGYYRGLLHKTDMVKSAIKGAEEFIGKLK
jgi:hypothetical protein